MQTDASGTPSHPDLRFLFGAFIAVALSFLGSYAYTQHVMAQVDEASDAIASNAAPSIEHLAQVRTAVRQAQLWLDRELARPDASQRLGLDRAISSMNEEAHSYLALPPFPGEKELWRELQSAVVALDGAIQRVLAQVDIGALAAPRASVPRVSDASERVVAAVSRCIEFNALNGREMGLRIARVRREATWIGYVLNACCGVFAVLAGAIVLRQIRRYGVLVDAYGALQDARAGELEAFAGRAAHDVRNPVAAAQMALDLLAARAALDPHGRELVDRARRNLQRTQTIIDGLLQFARAGAKPLAGAAADVASIVADTAASFRPACEQAHIEVQLEPLPACTVACSAGVLMSLISNLVQNAIKYMGDAPRRCVTLRALDVGTSVRVEVEDTGPGLPPGGVEELFKPFVRGPTPVHGGIGLGLATVRRLAETHGGHAGAHARGGEGAIFWFELPTVRTIPAG